jgi:subtilisin family serine protease
VGSVGLKAQFIPNGYLFWWKTIDVAEPTKVQDFFVSSFSGREKPGQDLDVLAPGDWIIGPYEYNSGQLGYSFWSGTSLSTPHVAGIVALMAQKKPSLTAAEVESLLQSAAKPMGAGGATIIEDYLGGSITEIWGTDATGAGLITADAALKIVK